MGSASIPFFEISSLKFLHFSVTHSIAFVVSGVWHEDEAKLSRKRHISVKAGVQGNGEGEAATVVGKPKLTKAGGRLQTG